MYTVIKYEQYILTYNIEIYYINLVAFYLI